MPQLKFLDNESQKKPPKKQKLVKHRRKNWAKTDISDVEQQIHDLNRQKLAGGVLAEKKDEELFVINKRPMQINEDDNDEANRKKTKNRMSLEEKLNNLNCYRNLKPDVISAPAHVVGHKPEPYPDSKRQTKLAEKAKVKAVKKAKKVAKTNTNKAAKQIRLSSDKFDVCFETNPTDIWNSSSNVSTKSNKLDSIETDYLKPVQKVLVKKPLNPLQKVESQNPKIELPHPGTSYNPEYEDHQQLLLKAHEVELKKLKKEEKELKKLRDSVPKMSWKQIEELWLEEMSLNQVLEDKSGENEPEKVENNETLVKKVSKKKKEAKLKRKKKQIMLKIKQKQKENEKKTRMQQNEVYRIKSILKELKEKEKQNEEKKLQKEIEAKHRELFEPKRLGRAKYEEPDIDLKLSDEITGSLRTLKPEGNIMMDSYKQLQKRNIIEPREKAKRVKPKFWKKTFDKRNAYEKTHFIK